jgi:hypothetical protein
VKIRQLDDADGRRTIVPVCDRGDDPVEALTAAAKGFGLRAASLTGIGAFAAVTLGFFDHARRGYRRRVIREQVEVVSLIGNIVLDRGIRGWTPTSWLPARTAAPWVATCWGPRSTRPSRSRRSRRRRPCDGTAIRRLAWR